MLLVDRVLDIRAGEEITTLKNVTFNEPFFQGHFPGHPVMPGVLIVEAMAQTAALLVVDALGADARGRLVYFMAIDRARFRRPVVPGDSLHITATKAHARGAVWRFDAVARVDEAVAAEATVTAMLRES
jgi:3-hydroxyacyl-[acyl-carrier-protein] dehydratase